MSSLLLLLLLLFCIFANKRQLAVQYYWDLLGIEQVLIPRPQILLLTLPPLWLQVFPPPPHLLCTFLCAQYQVQNVYLLLNTAQFLKACLKNLISFIQAIFLYSYYSQFSSSIPTSQHERFPLYVFKKSFKSISTVRQAKAI